MFSESLISPLLLPRARAECSPRASGSWGEGRRGVSPPQLTLAMTATQRPWVAPEVGTPE